MASLKFQKKKEFRYNGVLYVYKDNKIVSKLKVIKINNG